VPEPLDLGREHREIGQFRFLLRLLWHGRDHAREQVEQLLLEVDKVVIYGYPASGLRKRIRLRIFPAERSL